MANNNKTLQLTFDQVCVCDVCVCVTCVCECTWFSQSSFVISQNEKAMHEKTRRKINKLFSYVKIFDGFVRCRVCDCHFETCSHAARTHAARSGHSCRWQRYTFAVSDISFLAVGVMANYNSFKYRSVDCDRLCSSFSSFSLSLSSGSLCVPPCVLGTSTTTT